MKCCQTCVNKYLLDQNEGYLVVNEDKCVYPKHDFHIVHELCQRCEKRYTKTRFCDKCSYKNK